MARAFAEVAFTPSVQAAQTLNGSASSYAKFLAPEIDRGDQLSDREIAFITARDGFYQATVSDTGWPYVQFRGGPVGFIKVIDHQTIGYADFRGNRQYISVGNLNSDDRVSLILMDYPNQRRLKIWGKANLHSVLRDSILIVMVVLLAIWSLPFLSQLLFLGSFSAPVPILLLAGLVVLTWRTSTKIHQALQITFSQTFLGESSPEPEAETED